MLTASQLIELRDYFRDGAAKAATDRVHTAELYRKVVEALEELLTRRLELEANLAPHQKMNLLWLSRAESAEARVAELENALKPFADFSERFPAYFADDHHPLQSVTSPTVKDYRKAYAAFTAKLPHLSRV